MTTSRVQLWCAWCGPVLVGIIALGLVGFADLVPVNDPKDSAEEIARIYTEDDTRIRLGMMTIMIGMGLFPPRYDSKLWMRDLIEGAAYLPR